MCYQFRIWIVCDFHFALGRGSHVVLWFQLLVIWILWRFVFGCWLGGCGRGRVCGLRGLLIGLVGTGSFFRGMFGHIQRRKHVCKEGRRARPLCLGRLHTHHHSKAFPNNLLHFLFLVIILFDGCICFWSLNHRADLRIAIFWCYSLLHFALLFCNLFFIYL